MASKKTYFAEGMKAGFQLALDYTNSYWDYGPCGNCYYEHVELPNIDEPSQDDIDGAWNEYCEYWREIALNSGDDDYDN